MKTLLVLFTFTAVAFCFSQDENPFFKKWETPFQTPPFESIKESHYLPAFKQGMKQQQDEIEAIVNNTAAPDFMNTIEKLAASGSLLNKVSSVFYNQNSANTNDEIQKIAKEVAPLTSKHYDDINMNPKLFQRVKSVYENKKKFKLSTEQNKLLEEYYKDFVRGGANLNDEQKEKIRKINGELSLLTLKFGENLLKENNVFELVIDKEEDLTGLPDAVKTAAFETAKARKKEGKWIFTLQKPSFIPFLQYSPKRELREKIFKAYVNRGDNNDSLDNKEIISKIVKLRIEKAKLLGYKTHADFVLENSMASSPGNVYKLLNQLWEPALRNAKREAAELQAMIDKEGGNFKLEAWDWWYYAEKVKKEKYALDDGLLRPYFKLENVRNGAFAVASKLYGIQFLERTDIPKYHEEVKVFEVKEANGKHIGILYTDYYPRASKRSGAWMGAFRKQSRQGGVEVTPVITNVGNFSKPTADEPSLLSFDEVNTLFHELGHALHGLLSNSTYNKLSGTSVPRDFVELPSQIMENWAAEPEVLNMYAKHYKTGESIPKDLVEKIKNASLFNQGFETVEYLAASFLDMDYHTLTEAKDIDVTTFENTSLNKIGLMPEIIARYRSTNFQHIFSGGYAAGYYSYIWSGVLDSDAFEAFKETSLFDRKTAQAFRKYVLETGGTDDPMTLYKKFRGAEPKIEPLLKKRGLFKTTF